MKCSNRISNMQESPIRKLVPYANAARANGKKVYPLNIGQLISKLQKVISMQLRTSNRMFSNMQILTGISL